MSKESVKFINNWQWYGLPAVLLLLSQCLAPLDNEVSRYLSQSSVYIMLGFFAFGFFALIIHKPYVMLYSWLSCISLCQFLKDNENNPFYYAKANEGGSSICIAHLELKNSSADLEFLQKATAMKADLISVISHDALDRGDKASYLREQYPYCVNIGTKRNDLKTNYLFSKYSVQISDTLFYQGNPYISGSLRLDSVNGKRLHFLSFSIDEQISKNPQELMDCFETFAARSALENKDEPLMILGDVTCLAWEHELRSFRSRMVVNDSRLDLDLGNSNKHIFFSSHLRCLSFEQDANGVIGVYELKKGRREALKKDFFLSLR